MTRTIFFEWVLGILVAVLVAVAMPCFAVASSKPEIFVQMGHRGSVNAMAFSADGSFLLTGGKDKTVKLWDMASGREIRTFRGHGAKVESVAVSQDAKYLVSGDDQGVVKLWDAASGRELGSYKKHGEKNSISFVGFTRDRLIISADTSALKIWDPFSGKIIAHTDHLVGFEIPASNNHVLIEKSSGSQNGPFSVYDLASLREVAVFNADLGRSQYSVAFSRDGRRCLVRGNDKLMDKSSRYIAGLDTGNGRILFKKYLKMDTIWQASISPDGHYGLVAGDKLLLIDMRNGETLRVVDDRAVYAALFTPDGRRFASSAFFGSSAVLWDTAAGTRLREFGPRTGQAVNAMDVSADGELALAGYDDNRLCLWDLRQGTLVRSMTQNSGDPDADAINTVAISPNGDYGATGGYGVLKRWNLDNGKRIGSLDLNNIPGLAPAKYLEGSTVTSLAFSADSRYLALSQGEGNILVMAADNGRIMAKLHRPHTGCPVSLSPQGRYLLIPLALDNLTPSRTAGSAIVWDIVNGRESARLEGIGCAVFSPDGRHVLYGGNQGINQWDIADGNKTRTFDSKVAIGQFGLEFPPKSSDRFLVFSDSHRDIKIYAPGSPREITAFSRHQDFITGVKALHDGKSVLSSSIDGAMRLWDMSTGNEIAQFIVFKNGEWIVITPEGYYNSSANGDKYLNVSVGNHVYGIDQYRAAFYKPRIVQAVLQGTGTEGAVVQFTGEGQKPVSALDAQPPFVVIKSPEDGQKMDTARAEISIYVEDRSQPLKKVKIFVNGREVTHEGGRGITVGSAAAQGAHTRAFKLPVRLEAGENLVEVTAFNGFSEGKRSLRLYAPQGGASSGVILPNLWILAIGINKYQNPKLPSLSYAADDAMAIVQAFKKQKGKLFREVNALVLNDQAQLKPTYENIMDNLNYLGKAGHNDVAVLFIAGHGLNDDRGEFYFLPRDAVIRDDGTVKRSRAISWREIKSVLDIPAKKIVLADACHSEGVSGKKTRGVDSDRFVKELQEANAVIFASSRGRELSQESAQWRHGAFTYAIVEGLAGKADLIKDGKISMKELDTYVSETVPRITDGAQHPITNTPDGYVNFPVAVLK